MGKSNATKPSTRTRRRKQEEATVIVCEDSLDISLVQGFHGRLQAALVAKRPVIIEASQVERADTAVLQLLCAFVQEAQTRGLNVQWQQPTAALHDAACLLNLTGCLALPSI